MRHYSSPLRIPSDDRVLAYTAGLLDGEGTIHIKEMRRRGRLIYGMTVSIGNTSEAMLEFLLTRFGGFVYQRKKQARCKPFAIWEVSGVQAMEFLLALIPFMVVKRAQAVIAIRLGATKQVQRSVANPTPASVVSYQSGLKRQLNALNMRGDLGLLKAVGE